MKRIKQSEPAAGKRDGQLQAGAASPATTETAAADKAVAFTTTTTTSTTTPMPLSNQERAELAAHEKTIKQGLPQFIGVGNALMQILNKNLWRDYSSFADYALKKWGLGKSHAYRLIDAAKVVTEDLSPTGENAETLPTNEHQVRPLLALKTPKQRAKAWHTAVEKAAGGAVTGKIVAEAVAKINGAPAAKPKKRSPWAGLKKVASLIEEVRQLVAKSEVKIPRLGDLLNEVREKIEKLVAKI